MISKKTIKAQSGIIAAVLLILIVIIAAMIVLTFVVPFVKDQLQGGDCLAVAGKMEITTNPRYTCYNSTSEILNIQVHYGDLENLTKGFQLTIESAGKSKSIEVVPGTTDVKMYDGGTIELPGKNEERTYNITNITSTPESIEIYPILNSGKTCDASDSATSIALCGSIT